MPRPRAARLRRACRSPLDLEPEREGLLVAVRGRDLRLDRVLAGRQAGLQRDDRAVDVARIAPAVARRSRLAPRPGHGQRRAADRPGERHPDRRRRLDGRVRLRARLLELDVGERGRSQRQRSGRGSGEHEDACHRSVPFEVSVLPPPAASIVTFSARLDAATFLDGLSVNSSAPAASRVLVFFAAVRETLSRLASAAPSSTFTVTAVPGRPVTMATGVSKVFELGVSASGRSSAAASAAAFAACSTPTWFWSWLTWLCSGLVTDASSASAMLAGVSALR